MAFSVTQRIHEIGIRMALGAQRKNVLQQVLGQGLGLVALGEIIGLVAFVFVTQIASGILYGVSPRDPGILAIAVCTLTLVALVACYVPARRATRVDPMAALRSE
jgi:ABC-type antimicrobial peptide transport system permease subunit